VRGLAVSALGGMDETKDTIPVLITALKDKNATVRRYAAYALGNIGPAAREALPSLTDALKDQDKTVRDGAQWALKKIKAEK